MKYFSIVSVFALFVFIGAGCAQNVPPKPRPQNVPPVQVEQDMVWSDYEHDDLIRLTSDAVVTPIESPFVVTGEARGYWYFEASFPVILEDADGNEIATAIVQAESDWMTEEYVPFTLNISFPTQPSGSEGSLVFKKDNPSGLPEHDDEFVVPVTFE